MELLQFADSNGIKKRFAINVENGQDLERKDMFVGIVEINSQ